jgi:hypothetical protein
MRYWVPSRIHFIPKSGLRAWWRVQLRGIALLVGWASDPIVFAGNLKAKCPSTPPHPEHAE